MWCNTLWLAWVGNSLCAEVEKGEDDKKWMEMEWLPDPAWPRNLAVMWRFLLKSSHSRHKVRYCRSPNLSCQGPGHWFIFCFWQLFLRHRAKACPFVAGSVLCNRALTRDFLSPEEPRLKIPQNLWKSDGEPRMVQLSNAVHECSLEAKHFEDVLWAWAQSPLFGQHWRDTALQC